MKKKILSTVLFLAMMLTLFTVTALADPAPELYVNGILVTDENKNDILEDGKVSYNSETKTLTLADGATINAETGFNAITSYGIDLTVVSQGSSTITSKNYAAIYVAGGKLTLQGGTWDIDAEATAIYIYYGDIVIDNCSLDIDAGNCGICQDYAEDESCDYNCSVTVKDCEKVDIKSADDNPIYAGGVWDVNDDYVKGGNITVENCKSVTLNNDSSEYTAIYAEGGVMLKECRTVDIDAGWSGIGAYYGNVDIDSCDDISINAVDCGSWCYDDTNITDSKITVVCAIPEDYESKFGFSVQSYTSWTDGIYSEGTLSVTDSILDLTAADFGYDQSEKGSTDWGYNSFGIYAYDMIVDDSDITAKAGTADDANGINLGTLTVTGDSTVNAYGNVGTEEYYGLYAWDDVVLDGKNVEMNLFGGNNGLDTNNADYEVGAFLSEWWYDEDNGNALVKPNLTVKNGAHLNADASVEVQGDITIDNGKVKIIAPYFSALTAGGYEDKSNTDTYFGTLTVKNASSLIATTGDETNYYSAIYAYDSMDISDSEIFASAASCDAIGCSKNQINFNDANICGSLEKVDYADRKSIKTKAEIGYSAGIEKYTAMIGEDAALTVYINGACVYKAPLTAGEAQTLILDGKEAGEYTIIGDSCKGFKLLKNGKYVAVENGELKTDSDTAFTWKYDGGLYVETKTTCKSGFRFWSRTVTKTVKQYLAYDEGEFVLSDCRVCAEVQVIDAEHTYNYLHNGDGFHEAVCAKCGYEAGMEEHAYDAETHLCKCGKMNPDYCCVSDVKVTEKQIKKTAGFLFWKKTVIAYQYTICPETQNVGVCEVKYSANQENWNTGTVFTSDVKVSEFYIEVTDSNGKETLWKWDGTTTVPAN